VRALLNQAGLAASSAKIGGACRPDRRVINVSTRSQIRCAGTAAGGFAAANRPPHPYAAAITAASSEARRLRGAEASKAIPTISWLSYGMSDGKDHQPSGR